MIPLDATRPWFLLSLLALLPVALLARSTLTRLGPLRAVLSTSSRLLAVAALALALAGLRFVTTSDQLAVLFVLDRSRSLSQEDAAASLDWVARAAAGAGPRETVGLVVFGREASVEASPGPGLEVDKIHSVIAADGTDIARALRLASAAFPEGAGRRIVLVTDGNENAGDAVTEALAARARGTEVLVLPAGRAAAAEVRIDRVLAPSRVMPGEPYEVTAVVTSTHDTEAVFRLVRSRVPLDPVRRVLRAGTWPVTFAMKAGEEDAGGALDFEIFLQAPDAADTWRENNTGRAHVRVQGESRVLLVSGRTEEEEALVACLRDAGIEVELRTIAGCPAGLAAMDAFDAILLCDVPSRAVTPAQQEALRQYVHDLGGGLVMIGASRSFGGGAWQRTPVEAALPVDMDIRQARHAASLAVCIVIDSSGSMAAKTADGRTKLELAGEAAAEVVRVLGASDEIAVATVDTRTTWVQGLDQIESREAVESRVRSLRQGGGGIYCATGLRDALAELAKATAQMRHVILFADAADAEEHEGCDKLIEGALREGITLSVVAIGRETDKDARWLKDIADLGGGRFYITNDALELPRIFSEETVVAARSVVIEEEFLAVFAKPGQMIEGVDWDASPSLFGYVGSISKPAAEVLLETDRGDPLLAKWHYGLGRSAAFTSDARGRWAKEWIPWPGYRTLWPQVVRWVLRRADSSAFTIGTALSGGRATLTIDAVSAEGRFRDFLKLRIFAAGPAGSAEVPVRQTGPGRYEAAFDSGATGSWFVTVAEEDAGGWAARASVPLLIPYPAEYRTDGPNLPLLRRIAELGGGRVIAPEDAAGLFRHTAAPVRRLHEIWRILLGIAVAALLVDVLARRFAIPARRRIAASPAAPAGPAIDRLRGAKAQAVRPLAPLAVPPPPVAAPPSPPPPPPDSSGYLDRLREAKKRARR